MPTKKQLQEQLNQRIEDTLKLQEKQIQLGKVLDSTTENRLKQLTDIKNAEGDVNKLTDIQVDLTSEVNRLLEIEHDSVADIYKVEQDIVKNKIKEIGYQTQVNDLIAGAIANATLLDSTFGGVGASIKGFVANPLTAAIALLGVFNSQQETIAEQFGGIGVTKFRDELAGANQEFIQLGLSSKDAQTTVSNIANSFGLSVEESSKLVRNVGRITASTGMSTDEASKLVGLFTQTQGLTGDQAENLLLGARQLAIANDVAPDKVLSDIAADTEVFARFSKDGGENLLRAAVQARKLGINLGDVAKTADKLLSFQDSLNAEIEASILLGRDVNLQRARELSLANDIEGLQEELVKQVGTEAEFNKLNRIQRDALASALGMDVASIQKLVSRQGEQLTLQGEINRLTAENEIPEETITGTAQLLADFKMIGMQLAEQVGPTLNTIVRGVANFTGFLAESKLLIPALVLGLGAMAGRSLTIAGAQIAAAYALNPIGATIGTALAGVAIAGLYSSIPSAQEGGITTQEGLVNVHPQEAIMPIEKMGEFISDAIKPLVEETIRASKSNERALAEVGSKVDSQATRFADAVEGMA
jgi:hypothetical protein